MSIQILLKKLSAIYNLLNSGEINLQINNQLVKLGDQHNFPYNIITAKRKKRAYISSILAKNEIYRQYPYNLKLFVRAKLGWYILSPELKIKILESWQNIYKLLKLENLLHYYQSIVEQNEKFEVNIINLNNFLTKNNTQIIF